MKAQRRRRGSVRTGRPWPISPPVWRTHQRWSSCRAATRTTSSRSGASSRPRTSNASCIAWIQRSASTGSSRRSPRVSARRGRTETEGRPLTRTASRAGARLSTPSSTRPTSRPSTQWRPAPRRRPRSRKAFSACPTPSSPSNSTPRPTPRRTACAARTPPLLMGGTGGSRRNSPTASASKAVTPGTTPSGPAPYSTPARCPPSSLNSTATTRRSAASTASNGLSCCPPSSLSSRVTAATASARSRCSRGPSTSFRAGSRRSTPAQ
mmetsp:Transcript_6779/g.21595  ORF Transcript_6779/g.21595 Transcript_6779/m.21595 type:complete len:266 (+) Transcript_6779:941-1738(+)